jgi:hypothetical protein
MSERSLHLSPQGRGRIASPNAIRVRGLFCESECVESPLTRSLRYAPASTSPLRGEVKSYLIISATRPIALRSINSRIAFA